VVKITVISPHRGDAALALGLSVEAWLAKGHAVEVVSCFTRSEFAPYSDVGSVHANDRVSFVTAVRKREDEAWRKLHGAAKLTLTDLNLKDAPLRLHCKPADVIGRVGEGSEKVVGKILRALELSKPGAVVLPLALSGHVDQVTARDVALTAVVRAALPVAFYEELPHTARTAGAETVEAAVQRLALSLHSDVQPAFASSPLREEAAIESAVRRKRHVAWCYDSQIDEGATAEIAEFCRAYAGRERLWAGATWRGDGELMPQAS
jgi:LmbE family N-acetylglucosaminyl deacetylase